MSRPLSVRPPLSTPCAEPPISLSKKCAADIMRKPASNIASTLAGSPSSTCAPSIDSRPARIFGSSSRRSRKIFRSRLVLMMHELAVGGGRHGAQPVGLVERPLFQAEPCAERPALRQRQQEDVVGIGVVAFDVETMRALGHHRKHLQRDIAVDQPGDVDLAARRRSGEVAAPQQRVGMQVGNDKSFVKFLGLLRRRVGRRLEHAVDGVVDNAGQHEKEERERSGEQRCRAIGQPSQSALHVPRPPNAERSLCL